jgi:hypothetical protein
LSHKRKAEPSAAKAALLPLLKQPKEGAVAFEGVLQPQTPQTPKPKKVAAPPLPTAAATTAAKAAEKSLQPLAPAAAAQRKVAKVGAASPRVAPPRSQPQPAPEPFEPTAAMLRAAAQAKAAPQLPSAKVPIAQSSLDVVLRVLQENAQRAAKARERVAALDAAWRPPTAPPGAPRSSGSANENATGSGPAALYRQPRDAPGWRERAAAWKAQLPALMALLRARQLETRRHVAALSTRFEAAQRAWRNRKAHNKWGNHCESEGSLGEGLARAQSLAGARRASYRGNSSHSSNSSFLGDGIIRSDYEQEMILKELSREESLRSRIEKGTTDAVPPMLFAPQLKHLPLFHDESNGLVCDAAADEMLRRADSPWTDLEKCVFLDKFLQFPKNFGKVATFLTHKTAKDCVRFYYDSKKDIDYKVGWRN